MMCIKTFTEKISSDFNSWDDWIKFLNENERFARTESKIWDWFGKCIPSELPSYHPYWGYISLYADGLDRLVKSIKFLEILPSLEGHVLKEVLQNKHITWITDEMNARINGAIHQMEYFTKSIK